MQRLRAALIVLFSLDSIVDDPTGAAVPVSVSHFTTRLNQSTEEVSQLLPVGTVLAIREPYVSVDHQSRAGPCVGKADHGIRVDSPTDIIILENLDIAWAEGVQEDTPVTTSWMRASNLLSCDTAPTDEQLHAELKSLVDDGRPGEAHRLVARARKAGRSVDARMEATVLFHLNAWEAAGLLFDQAQCSAGCSDVDADERAAADFALPLGQLTLHQAALRCRFRIAQESNPLSTEDVRSIYFAAADGASRLDTSDYIGAVAVKDIAGAGRGLVTTRAVEPGELLLCCRAVCAAYPPDVEDSPLLRLNLENAVVSTTSQVRAQTMLIHAIVGEWRSKVRSQRWPLNRFLPRRADRPELALPILGLTAGPSTPDSAFVSQEFPLRTSVTADIHVNGAEGRPDVDAGYVDGVLRFNAFGPAQMPSRSGKASRSDELERSTMPHPLPAILNHACLPNVSSVFFADIVTTRALSHLPAGTEIVHQYVKGDEPLAIRRANLSKHGFECCCAVCVMDRADGADACIARARIMQGESKAVFDRSALLLKSGSPDQQAGPANDDAHTDIIEALETLIERINATYHRQRGSLRPDLFKAIDARTRHTARKDLEHALLVSLVVLADGPRCLLTCGAPTSRRARRWHV